MFLPPSTAYLADYKLTYGELRSQMIAQSRDPLARAAAARGDAVVYSLSLPAGAPLGVASGGLPSAQALRNPLTATATTDLAEVVYPTYASLRSGIKVMDSCLAGQIWCWHTCEDISAYNLTCPSSEVTCVGPDGQPADPDLHVPANHPGCVGQVKEFDVFLFSLVVCSDSHCIVYFVLFLYLSGVRGPWRVLPGHHWGGHVHGGLHLLCDWGVPHRWRYQDAQLPGAVVPRLDPRHERCVVL